MRQREPNFQKYIQTSSSISPPGVIRLIDDYRSIDSGTVTERDCTIVENLTKNGSDLGLYYAGAIALDIASREMLDRDERVTWLLQAYNNWSRINENTLRTGNLTALAINSVMHQAALPSYQAILTAGSLPKREARSAMYLRLMGLGRMSITRLAELAGPEASIARIDERKDLAGTIGELSVLLLMQRFARQELDDKEQITLPSRFSEDRGKKRHRGSTIVNAWDLSVFQQFSSSDQIEMPYRIQVKTRENNHNPHYEYGKGISLVRIREDLSLSSDEHRNNSLGIKIIKELLDESNSSATTETLNARTELLLDKIEV